MEEILKINWIDQDVRFFLPKEVCSLRKSYLKETDIFWVNKSIFISCNELIQGRTAIIVFRN